MGHFDRGYMTESKEREEVRQRESVCPNKKIAIFFHFEALITVKNHYKIAKYQTIIDAALISAIDLFSVSCHSASGSLS